MTHTLVRRYLVGALVLAAAGLAQAQTVETFAGGRAIDNMPAHEAPITPGKMAIGPDGSIYVTNEYSHMMMRRDPLTGILTLGAPGPASTFFNPTHYAFFGRPGFAYLARDFVLYERNLSSGGSGTIAQLLSYGSSPNCQFNHPHEGDMAVDGNGTVYFTEWDRHAICRLIAPNTWARFGGNGTAGFSGDGGPVSAARFSYPTGVIADAANNIYIADTDNNRIRRVSAATGIITTIAGTGVRAHSGDNIPAASASFNGPRHFAFDAQGNLYVSEHVRVRRIDAQTGLVTTIAGNGTYSSSSIDGGLATQTPLGNIEAIGIEPNGDLLISDRNNQRVRRVARDTGIITSVIGNGFAYFCGDNLAPREVCLNRPVYVAVDTNGDVYISDSDNRRVRKFSAATGLVTTVAGRGIGQPGGEGGPAVDAIFPATLGGVALDAAGNLYIAGASGNRISRVDRVTGILTHVVGTGVSGFSGDYGPATFARTNYIPSVAIDDAGDLYFSDTFNNRVRKVSAGTGIITTVAGNGNSAGPLGDGGPATSASLFYPEKVGFDLSGNLLIADAWHKRIRRVDRTTGIITTVVGNGTQNSSGDGGPAVHAGINNAWNFVVDPAGNILLVDGGGVRRVDATTGFINWITALNLTSPEGFALASARDIALDSSGRLYVGTYEAVLRVNGLPATIDTTPPIITPNITGTAGVNGWYRSNVGLTWTMTDAESAISTSSGCTASSVTSDTAGISFSCAAYSSGGYTSRTVTIRRDTVAPRLTFGAANPAPNASGWNSTDVHFSFVASDPLSGVYTTSSGSPLSIQSEGMGLTRQIIVTDFAGNSATFTTPAVNIDRSAPVVTPNVSGTLGSNGWYTSDVAVSWTTTDDNAPISATEGCDTSTVTSDTASVTFTCTATSAGGSTTQSVTVKRDATAPQLEFGAPTPAANAAGWHSGDVSIPFTATDSTSGVSSTSVPNPVLIAGLGANLSSDVVVTDAAGNSATFPSPAVNIDRSAPTVTANVSGTPGANGWYTSDIQVAWTTNDDHAPVDSSEGCEMSAVTSDTAGVTFTCTATSAGGSTTESITVRRDATPPQLVFGAPTPAPNAAGWFASDVSFGFDTTDATSGVASSSSSPVVITGEGANLSAQVVVTDGAGNSATFDTPAVSIDRAPPSVVSAISGVLGNNGWYTSDVQVNWTIDESPASIISSSGCDSSNVTADTAAVTFTCSVVSGGGTASSSVTVKRDATPPVLTFGTPSPVPNANGWNKTNVSVSFTRSDAQSGLASTSTTSPLVIGTEGAGVMGQVIVTDLAGNTATFATVPRNIDKTPPVVNIVSPANDASYGFYQDVIGDYSCTDNLSLQSCVGPTAHGEAVNTRTAGARTFRVTGKDLAPFTTAVTHSFTVASLFNFSGFTAPSSEPPTLNLVARGSLVPVRWQLPDGNGGFVTNPASFTSATVGSLTCGSADVVPYNDTASGPAGIHFDASTNTFSFNWQTNPGWTGCRKLTIKLRDNTLHELRFRFQ